MSRLSDGTTYLSGTRAAARDRHFVAFRVGDWNYALEVAEVCGIYHGLAIIPTPDEPESMAGEVSLAAHRIPVADLRTLYNLPERFGAGWLLVVRQGESMIGVLVDHVSEVIHLAPQALEPFSADSSPNCPPGAIAAVARQGDRLFHVPDLSRILGEYPA